jgi:hypothetical protein
MDVLALSRVSVRIWCARPGGGHINRRWCVGVHHRGVVGRTRGNRSGAFAAVASMGKLMIVQTACELGLLEMGSDVLVRHFL